MDYKKYDEWDDLTERKKFVVDVSVKFALIYVLFIVARAIL